MKNVIAKLVAILATLANVSALFFIFTGLAKSELLHLSHFIEMVSPTTGWYFNNPETRLFAYHLPTIIMFTSVFTFSSLMFTIVYVKLRKSSLNEEERKTFESRIVLLTSINIASLLSLLMSFIPAILLYRFIPMSIFFLVLWVILIKYLPLSKIIIKI